MKELVNGKIVIPLPTYFTIGKHPLPQLVIEKLEQSDGEVCPNLYFLNKRSTTKTSEGLRIVNLGGTLDPAVTAGLSKDRFLPFHTVDDSRSLHGANSADILITSHWPSSILAGSHISISDENQVPPSEKCVADLCSALKPRYHFSTSSDLFYEREPFFHLSDSGQPDPAAITRFISLASPTNTGKQKYLYAFTLSSPAAAMPPGTTASPLNPTSKKRAFLPDQAETFSRFSSSPSQSNNRPHKRARNHHSKPLPQSACFFCLSNPTLSTHLISSIGTESYLTIAKGPLPTSTTYPTLPHSGHILIIPLAHTPTLAAIPPSSRASAYKEMQRYRRALHSLLIDRPTPPLGAVTWELSRAAGVHVHWQFLPVPADLIKRGLVEAAFKVSAENDSLPTFKSLSIGDGALAKTDYFRLWIWRPVATDTDGADAANGASVPSSSSSPSASYNVDEGPETRGKEKELVLEFPPDAKFDVQFGRKVMAKLLRLEDRMDWKDCRQSVEEEGKDAEGFKAAFRKFDFSFEE